MYILITQSNCQSQSSFILTCITPQVQAPTPNISYVLRLDNAPPPNVTQLVLAAVPDPIITEFVPQSIPLSTLENGPVLISFSVSTFGKKFGI